MSESLTQFSNSVGAVTSRIGTGTTELSAASSTTVIPANAEAPVWQPWVNAQAQGLSQLKTGITHATADYERALGEAQRLLDAALGLAAEQTRRMESAAWAAWNKYMNEAKRTNDAIMIPAYRAYDTMIENAKNQFVGYVTPLEHTYARVVQDTTWAKNTTTGSATVGTG